MRKGEWYLVSDAKGVVSIGHVLLVSDAENRIDFEIYPRPDFVRTPVDHYPLALFMIERYSATTYKGKEVTPMKTRDARNLLKLLQRKQA